MTETSQIALISGIVVPALGGTIWFMKRVTNAFVDELKSARKERQTEMIEHRGQLAELHRERQERCESHNAIEIDMTQAIRDSAEILRAVKTGMEKVCSRLDENGGGKI